MKFSLAALSLAALVGAASSASGEYTSRSSTATGILLRGQSTSSSNHRVVSRRETLPETHDEESVRTRTLMARDTKKQTGRRSKNCGYLVPQPSFPDGSRTYTIPQIQGRGLVSPLEGLPVYNVRGIVTAVDSNLFYFQDPHGDGDDETSDALVVFTSSRPTVKVGDYVAVDGTVSEFTPGGIGTRNLSTTQIGFATVTILSSGNALPPPVILGSNSRRFRRSIPDQSMADGIAYFESLEAMLVRIPSPTVVGATNDFGEIFTAANEGRFASGISQRGTLNIDFYDFNPERIQIDADSGVNDVEIPMVDVGTILLDVVGVVGYDFGNFEIIPTKDIQVDMYSNLMPEVTKLEGDAENLLIASYNVLNLDPNDADGEDADIADGRFIAIAKHIVYNLNAPDIVALQEIQDNNGIVDDGTTSATLTLQTLVNAIKAEDPKLDYKFVDNIFQTDGCCGGAPGGNIRVAYIYNPRRVKLMEDSVATFTEPAPKLVMESPEASDEEEITPTAEGEEGAVRRLVSSSQQQQQQQQQRKGAKIRGLQLAPSGSSDIYINEIEPNPAGDDPATQQVEIRGPPGEPFTQLILLSVESDSGTSQGRVDGIYTFNNGAFDANGLYTATVSDLENPSFTLILTDSFTGSTSTDIDSDNNGTPEDVTTIGTILDAISILDAPTGDLAYADTTIAFAGEPELIFRDGITFEWYYVASGTVYNLANEVIDAFEFDQSPSALTFGLVNPTRSAPPNAFLGSRLPLVATWKFLPQNTEFTTINVHFSSKGGSAAIAGRAQPFEKLQENFDVNGSLDERIRQSKATRFYIESILADQPNVILLGDMNEFEFVSSVKNFEGIPMKNLIDDIEEKERYSFVFQGNSQALDHIFVSQSLCPDSEVDYVHVNSEFAVSDASASDHDPVLAKIYLAEY
ncbi:hypothetical protein ACA910_016731 [Epithemia clementina (nom. ined.)]